MQERVVSLFDAVQLVNAGESVIDKNYNQGIGWQFLFTMKQNEYFVFPKTEKREKVNEETGEIISRPIINPNAPVDDDPIINDPNIPITPIE